MEKIIDEFDTNKFIDVKGSYIIAQGGDGTLLKAIHKYKHFNLPFFGVSAGTENFLMNRTNKIKADAVYKQFTLINAEITYSYFDNNSFHSENSVIQDTITVYAFNEICIGGDMSDWVTFNVHDNDRIIGKFKGSGVIFSTAQGSTGINKNNNGVILPLSSSNWSVTGDKCNRKINYVLNSNKTSVYVESRSAVNVWVDGKNKVINNVSKVTLSKGETVTVIFNDYDEFKRKRRL